jgi:ubiquinone biosynthesis protein
VDLAGLTARLEGAAAEWAARLGVDPKDRASMAAVSLADMAEGLAASLRVLAASGFAVPKELVLFFKNLLYLNGFAAAVAPDAEVVGQLDTVLADFLARHGPTLAQVLADP